MTRSDTLPATLAIIFAILFTLVRLNPADASDYTLGDAVTERVNTQCIEYLIDDITKPADIDRYLAHGWTSDPTDQRESLYSPGCQH